MRKLVLAILPKEYDYYQDLMQFYSQKVGTTNALALPPHITVIPRLRVDNYDTFLRQVQEVCVKTRPFTLSSKQISCFTSPKVINIAFDKNQDLIDLHYELWDKTKDFTNKEVKVLPDDISLTKKQQEYLEEFGNPFIKEYYTPHLTLASGEFDEKHFSNLPIPIKKDIFVDSIYVLEKTDAEWVIRERLFFN